jgi:hypothetical protein
MSGKKKPPIKLPLVYQPVEKDNKKLKKKLSDRKPKKNS